MLYRRVRPVAALALILLSMPTGAAAETLTVYAAGSLRGLVTALSAHAAALGMTVQPTFAGSGTLRDRIEQGARPDLLLSADMAAPAALAAEGRTISPPVAFARNRLCLVARRALHLGAANLVDGLLADDVRIRTSKPIADPAGDYAMAMFDRMDAAYPGAGKRLRANAEAQASITLPPLAPGANATAALFDGGRIDVAVTYCSASGDLTKSAADVETIPVPADYDPKPVFGLAILSANPSAARFAALLLSKDGQSAVAAAGLLPLSTETLSASR